MRGVVISLPLSLVLWAIILATGHAIATGAPPKDAQAPIHVGTLTVQEEFDRTALWLSEVLRTEIPSRPPVEVTDHLAHADHEGEFHYDGRIKVRPFLADSLAFREIVALGRFHIAPGPHLLIHESLHREETVGCWIPSAGQLNVEEGIVDALTADLVPAWGWRFWRQRIAIVPRYRAEVAAIRAASARATGSSSWRERSARHWRRALWGASCDGRAAMLAEVR